jgi:hypothetical protein
VSKAPYPNPMLLEKDKILELSNKEWLSGESSDLATLRNKTTM